MKGNEVTVAYQLDEIGLPSWQPPAEQQAEMDALPRVNCNDPQDGRPTTDAA
jgi:hypothetical protein